MVDFWFLTESKVENSSRELQRLNKRVQSPESRATRLPDSSNLKSRKIENRIQFFAFKSYGQSDSFDFGNSNGEGLIKDTPELLSTLRRRWSSNHCLRDITSSETLRLQWKWTAAGKPEMWGIIWNESFAPITIWKILHVHFLQGRQQCADFKQSGIPWI